jgi:rhamnulokinase
MLPVRGHLHWNIHRLFDEIQSGLAICAQKTHIESLAVDTWGVDFGLLARDGTILGLPFAYRDAHTQGAMEEFFKKIPRKRIYDLTGIQFLPFNSLFQLYAIKRDKSSLLETASDLLFMPDLFQYLLTGEKKTEFTFATTTQLYNPKKREWEGELFDALGLSRSLMQEIVQPGTMIGNLDERITRQFGWKGVPVIAIASHDTGSAVAAVPAQGEDWAFISSGTWSLMGIETNKPIINDLALELNFTNEGGVEGTFRFLKNIAGLWLLQKCCEVWPTGKQMNYDSLMAMALEAKPFGFIIDPDWGGFLNPVHMPKTIQRYCVKTGQAVLPVYAGPAEATAIGNIMMQSMSSGWVPSLEKMREIVRNSFDIVVYEPAQTEDWKEALGLFHRILLMESNDGKNPKD